MRPSQITNIKLLGNHLRCEEKFLQSYLLGDVQQLKDEEEKEIIVIGEGEHIVRIAKISIPKRNRRLGYREIHMILTENLRNLLKILNTHLESLYTAPPSVHGFVKKRSIRTNASLHLTKNQVLSVDIERFYDHITHEMIRIALKQYGFTDEISSVISKLVTLNGTLPQGFTTSPALSNIILLSLDQKMVKLAGEKVVYTRYADDLYFSSNDELPAYSSICKIVNQQGFMLNDQKTQLMKRGSNQYVTGLTVFDEKSPRIPKRRKRNLRLEIHYIKKKGYLRHVIHKMKITMEQYEESPLLQLEVFAEIGKCRARIEGWIFFIRSVEISAGDKLLTLLNKK